MKKTSETEKSSSGMISRRLAALIGVVLLVMLYIVTLVVAIVDTSSSGEWFRICLFATVAVPLLIWIYTWMYGKLTDRHTIADPDMRTTASPGTEADSDATAAPGEAAGPDTDITVR